MAATVLHYICWCHIKLSSTPAHNNYYIIIRANQPFFNHISVPLRCRASQDCPAFLIDYDNDACYRLDTNTDDSRELIVDTDRKTNYFEKVCLNGKEG